MKTFFAFLVVCLTAVSGFIAPAPRISSAMRPSSAMRMGLKDDIQKAATGASVALLSAAPAMATEGTGEAFGIENSSLLILPLVGLVGINVIYLQWAKAQPEGDFFSEYDERRA